MNQFWITKIPELVHFSDKNPPPHQNTSYEHVQVNKKNSTQLPQCVQSNIVKHHRVSVPTSWFETLHPRMDKDILTNFGEGSKGFFGAGYGRPKDTFMLNFISVFEFSKVFISLDF